VVNAIVLAEISPRFPQMILAGFLIASHAAVTDRPRSPATRGRVAAHLPGARLISP